MFNAAQNELVITLAELIIPETETPGAKAAKVNEYIDAVLADAEPELREKFLQGLAWMDAQSEERFRSPFVSAPPPQQIELLTGLSTATAPSPADAPGVEFFQAIKGMTITGYYTSELGLIRGHRGRPPDVLSPSSRAANTRSTAPHNFVRRAQGCSTRLTRGMLRVEVKVCVVRSASWVSSPPLPCQSGPCARRKRPQYRLSLHRAFARPPTSSQSMRW